MRKLRSVISLIVLVCLLFSLAGCSGAKNGSLSSLSVDKVKDILEKKLRAKEYDYTRNGGKFNMNEFEYLRDGYYIAEDEDEAREFASFKYSMKSLLTSQIEEEFDDEYYRTSSISLYSFEESEDAEEVFDSAIKELARYYDVEFAEKDGYQYVCYTESGEPVCKEAIYLCDTNILYIRAYCPEDGKTGFGSYIFKELGLVEPKVKD